MNPTGLEAVGWAVEVYWPDEEQWFNGEVAEFDPDQGYYIHYDDGDTEWIEANASTLRFINKIDHDEPPEPDAGIIEAEPEMIVPPDDDGQNAQEDLAEDTEHEDHEEDILQDVVDAREDAKAITIASGAEPAMLIPPESEDEGEKDDEQEELRLHLNATKEIDMEQHEAHTNSTQVVAAEKDVLEEENESESDPEDNTSRQLEIAASSDQEHCDEGENRHTDRDDLEEEEAHILLDESDQDDNACFPMENATAMPEKEHSDEKDIIADSKEDESPLQQQVTSEPKEDHEENLLSSDTDDDFGFEMLRRPTSRPQRITHVLDADQTSSSTSLVPFPASAGPPGPGKGQIYIQIVEAADLVAVNSTSPPNAFVKVSYVAPGRKSLMLRCKTALKSTSVIENTANPVWHDLKGSSFHYTVPRKMDWNLLSGDLLFAVYDVDAHDRKHFLGQSAIALSDFLDRDPENPAQVHAGIQLEHNRWYDLQDRSGEGTGAALHLILQLQLPPPMGNSRRSSPEAAAESAKSIRSNHSFEAKSIGQRSAASKARRTKATAKPKPKSKTTTPRAAHNSIKRRQEQDKIAKENEKMAQRLKSIAPKKAARMGTKEAKAIKRQVSADKGRAKTLEKQQSLISNVTELQQQVSVIQQSIIVMKAKCSRLEIYNRKTFQTIQQMNKATSSKNTRKAATMRATTKRKSSSVESREADEKKASSVSLEKLEILEQEHSALSRQKQTLARELRTYRDEEAEAEEKMEQLEKEYTRIKQLQVFMKDPSAPKLQKSVDLKEFQQIKQVREELRTLQIEVEVLRQATQSSSSRLKRTDDFALDHRTQLETKCRAKQAKIDRAEQERDEYRQKYNQIIHDDVREKLREKLRLMQNTVFLCEREESFQKQANDQVAADVSRMASKFQSEFHDDRTETDLLFSKSK